MMLVFSPFPLPSLHLTLKRVQAYSSLTKSNYGSTKLDGTCIRYTKENEQAPPSPQRLQSLKRVPQQMQQTRSPCGLGLDYLAPPHYLSDIH